MIRLLITATLLALSPALFAQKFTISGLIKDAKTGEELTGATVFAKEAATGASANSYGFYSLTLPKGSYTLVYSYVGYEDLERKVELTQNLKIDIELTEESQTLKDVVITGEKLDRNVKENRMSVVSMDAKTLKRIPILLGEADLVKAVQLLPGVQAAGDGNTLMIVRGGNVDHNLILLDEAVVYNPTHAVGFFSVFNGDAIKDFDIYKGGIPSQFGGRLASVLDVRMRDGNSKNFSASGGIGLLSARLTLEGPIQKDKSAFMVSGRRSYFDLFFPLGPPEIRDNKAYFWDLNAKANFTLGKKDRLYISAYAGRDELGVSSLFGFGWGNRTLTARWNHIFNAKLFMNTSLIVSRYNYDLKFKISESLNLQRSNYINDVGIKTDFTNYISPTNTLRFGGQIINHVFQPGEIKPMTENSFIFAQALPLKRALEHAWYVSNKTDISSRLNVEYGVRVSFFHNHNSREWLYANGTPTQVVNGIVRPSDSIGLQTNDGIYNTYYGVEPRLNAAYLLNEKSSVKFSYNRMYQYLHLIQNITASTGQEFWIPSNSYIRPQMSDQVAGGYFRNFFDNKIEFSAEAYYKWMHNTLELIDNADVQFIEGVESQLVSGQGRAYGFEFLARKSRGRNTGWLGYTLAWSQRRADNINNGEWYSFRFDRRHYITAVFSRDMTERINFSVNWIFGTGEAVTVPIGTYEIDGVTYPLFSNRNSFRIPDYHRMDMSLTLYRKKIPGRVYKNESNWLFSIYNVYARKNVYNLTFQFNETTGQNEILKTYLFRIVPSITYNFKF